MVPTQVLPEDGLLERSSAVGNAKCNQSLRGLMYMCAHVHGWMDLFDGVFVCMVVSEILHATIFILFISPYSCNLFTL